MKKIIVLSLAVAMTLVASVTAFAKSTSTVTGSNNQEGIRVEVKSLGKGACRHAGCRCTWYVRAQGGAGKCCCGHWDYVHN